MKRRALLLLLIGTSVAAEAALPAVTLLVELRWVESALAPAAQAGVRDGAVVVGTGGAVSPQGPGVVTATAGAAAEPPQALRVANGERAQLRLTTREPLQWLDTVAELSPQGSVRGLYARPQAGTREAVRSITVLPSWAGGRAPVRLAFQVDEDGHAVTSTRDLPLERWQTVAQTGGATPPAPRGTTRSTDAVAKPERALQVRVSILPQP
ncbi:MAG: hypothetical protein EKK53_15050 [Burkholderiales bacterium]|nr:MAG: hypothetical protein EKK53_15050 [Burkholderiales bacterium]